MEEETKHLFTILANDWVLPSENEEGHTRAAWEVDNLIGYQH